MPIIQIRKDKTLMIKVKNVSFLVLVISQKRINCIILPLKRTLLVVMLFLTKKGFENNVDETKQILANFDEDNEDEES